MSFLFSPLDCYSSLVDRGIIIQEEASSIETEMQHGVKVITHNGFDGVKNLLYEVTRKYTQLQNFASLQHNKRSPSRSIKTTIKKLKWDDVQNISKSRMQ